MIYHALNQKRTEIGNSEFDFSYEKYPVNDNGEELKIKTDFTIVSKGRTWYWEHLGRLGNRLYERTWKNFKRPTYRAGGFENSLITTDEIRGIMPDKIEAIIQLIAIDNLDTEDKTNRYSNHHYSLR